MYWGLEPAAVATKQDSEPGAVEEGSVMAATVTQCRKLAVDRVTNF